MNYQDRINQSKQKVYEKAVATKICDLMDKLRLSSNENNKRRWIWELLQNAKDVKSHERKGVDVVVELRTGENSLIFRHNGRCFSTDNITFLIEQVSTKDRSTENLEDTTGKFGTGFLTTHLLSEIVEVQGVIQDDKLPYRKFCITLDRSSRDIPGIIHSVNKSIEQLNQLDQAEDYNEYDENKFNTSFTYRLDQNGLDIATIGISDLEKSLPLTLAFLPSISSVEINQDNIYFVSGTQDLVTEIDNFNVRLFKVDKNSVDQDETYEFVSVKENCCEILIPVEFKDLSIFINDYKQNIVPRLFCDFPLVGSENFGVPFFINSSHFHPTEPRDGIFLTDKDDSRIKLNKEIVKTSVSCYLKLIDYASSQGWKNLYYLAAISMSSNEDWLSIDWYKENILKLIQEKIYITPLVTADNGKKISLKGESGHLVNIPFNNRKEIREAIWDLVQGLNFFTLPVKVEIHEWYEIFENKIWDRNHCLTISQLSADIVEGNSNLADLSCTFGIKEPIIWLNQYFSLLQRTENNLLDFLQNNTYKIIPNQYGEFCLPSELKHDLGIEKALKDIGKQLFKDYYKILAETSISISNLLPPKSQTSLINEMNEALKLKTIDLDKKKNACHSLTQLFPPESSQLFEQRSLIYDVSKKFFDSDILGKHFLEDWSSAIWEISDRMQAEFIVETISKLQKLDGVSTYLSEDTNEVCDWLSAFVSLLVKLGWKDLLEDKCSILPNQNGAFCDLNSLFSEEEVIDESLKNISASLRRDFRDELIDVRFDIRIPQSRRISQKNVGSEIRDLVTPLLSELPRSKPTQNIFDELVLWMDCNPEIAKDIFGDLYENRHKLYDDHEVAKNLREVCELKAKNKILSQENQILKAENDELKNELEKLKEKITGEGSSSCAQNKKKIDDDFLLTFGVTTKKQLEEILCDPEISKKYVYSNQDDYDPYSRLLYVLEIIQRAKQNVRKYLESLENYDCSGWTEPGMTFISGVLKQGNPIQIIVRPSDNKKIIFYYPEEKQVLSLVGSELWVEDGESHPVQITLGMVLKFQGIDCLYLP